MMYSAYKLNKQDDWLPIPHSVRAAEISSEGKSIFEHDPGGKVSQAYHALTKEVMQHEAERNKHKPDPIR